MSDLGEHAAIGWALAYLGLLVWQCAGLLDFILHRRADLPHTSGLPESSMHLLQLSLVGAAIVLGMLFDSSLALLATVLLLVALHAAVGYADTRQAFRHRPIVPLEQHVHSILDMAPWIGLGLLTFSDPIEGDDFAVEHERRRFERGNGLNYLGEIPAQRLPRLRLQLDVIPVAEGEERGMAYRPGLPAHVLEVGDSAYFPARLCHSLGNAGRSPARACSESRPTA